METEMGTDNLTRFNGAELDRYLQRLLEDSSAEDEATVAAAYKTVDTFSGLLHRKMWLKNSREGAYTDGWEIGAPFKHEYFYQLVEHEISHNLFQSNFKAKEAFSRQYAEQIRAAVERSGRSVSAQEVSQLEHSIGMFVNVLEDHRVNSLWAMLYPGSYTILQGYSRDLLAKPATKAQAHESLITYFLLTAYDVAKVPAGKLDRLRPALVAALKKVERKGPAATFVLCKWLVTQVVSELIRTLRGEPPPPDAGTARIAVQLADGAAPQGAGDSSGSDSGAVQTSSSGADSQDGKDGSNTGAAQGQSAWQPPAVQATAEQRIEALQNLIKLAGTPNGGPTQGEMKVQALLGDVKPNRFDQKGDNGYTKDLVAGALNTDVTNTSALDLQLARSEQQMDRVIAGIEKALQEQRQRNENEWITRDAGAKVTFKDIESSDTTALPLDGKDRQTAAKLRNLFSRVKIRRKLALTDSGAEIDVQAYVASRVGRSLDPVFKHEESGRGFKVLLLLDRSSSMKGPPSTQVERAARILRTALKNPNVQVHVWGFQSNGHEVLLTRIAPNLDVQDSVAMPVKGETPLHVAVRTAVNWMGTGDETKQLIVLTDGKPVFSTKDGNSYGEKTLMMQVQKECRRARKLNIETTAIGIGSAVSDADMRTMFGERKHWTLVPNPLNLNRQLVDVVRASFTRYLKGT